MDRHLVKSCADGAALVYFLIEATGAVSLLTTPSIVAAWRVCGVAILGTFALASFWRVRFLDGQEKAPEA